MHVLIVEDDELVATLFDMMLRNRGVGTTVVTRDFDIFYDQIDWPGVDAILCDKNLEAGDGRQLLKRVCEEHPSVIRLLITADVTAEDEETFADHVLHKPTESLVIFEKLGIQ